MLQLALPVSRDLERVDDPGMHGSTSGDVGDASAAVIVGELIAGVGAPGRGCRVQRPERDDDDGDDEDESCHGSFLSGLTTFWLVLGYWSNVPSCA